MATVGLSIWPGVPITSTSFSGLFPTSAIPGGSTVPGNTLSADNNLYPGLGVFAGQGNLPILDVYISFSGIATSPPVWTWVSPNDIRNFSISRTEGETGTCDRK